MIVVLAVAGGHKRFGHGDRGIGLLVFYTNLTCISLDVVHPLWDMTEGICFGDVISDNDTVCSSVVALRDCTESLLTSSIPNLQLCTHIHVSSSAPTLLASSTPCSAKKRGEEGKDTCPFQLGVVKDVPS